MSEDDDLRDDFGTQITAALDLRSRAGEPTETMITIDPRPHRGRTRRALLVAAVVIVVLAIGVPLVVSRTHDAGRVGTFNPSSTTQERQPTTTTSSTPSTSTRPTTSPTTNKVSVIPVVPVRTVTTSGVGTLRFGVATEADVRTVIGAPAAVVRGNFGISSFPDYRALGYQCSNSKGPGRIRIGVYGADTPPYCRTVFYLNVNTATLAGFATTTSAYVTAHGTSVGMTGAQAARRESRPVVRGCFTGIAIGGTSSGTPQLFVFVAVYTTNLVNGISADNPANSVGVLFC